MMVVVKVPTERGGSNVERFTAHGAVCVYFNRMAPEARAKTRSRLFVESDDVFDVIAGVMASLEVYGTDYDVDVDEGLTELPHRLAGKLLEEGSEDEF
jgi:hypothetical protein